MKRKDDYYEAELRREQERGEQRAWLDEVINRLSGRPVWKCDEIKYWNHPDLPDFLRAQGYYVCYQTSDRWGYPIYLMISRSHTNEGLKLDQIIADLGSSEIVLPFAKFGEYPSRSRAQRAGAKVDKGKYATIKFGERWYMISRSGLQKPYFKLVDHPSIALPKKTLSAAELFSELNQRLARKR